MPAPVSRLLCTHAVLLIACSGLAPIPTPLNKSELSTVTVSVTEAVTAAKSLSLSAAIETGPLRVDHWILEPSVVMGYASRKVSMVNLTNGEVLGPYQGRYNFGPAGLVQDGHTVDAVLSPDDGRVINILGTFPDGTSTNRGVTLLPHPTEARIHVFGTRDGSFYSGVWKPGGPVSVPLTHPIPFVPDMLALDAPLALSLEALKSDESGCVFLTMPADGRSQCLTKTPVGMISQYLLDDDSVIVDLPDGPQLERDGHASPLLPEGTCSDPALEFVLASPPRALIRCPSTQTLHIWSTDTLWSGPQPETHVSPDTSFLAAVVPYGDIIEERTQWLSLEGGHLLETEPLRAQAYNRFLTSKFAAWNTAGALFWVDTLAATVTHVGNAPCETVLFWSKRSEKVIECQDEEGNLTQSFIVEPDGWWSTPYRVEGIKGDQVLLSDQLRNSFQDSGTRLWTATLR